MIKYLLFNLCLLLFVNSTFANEIDSLLSVLEQTMLQRQKYDSEKELSIKSIKELLNKPNTSQEQVFYLNNQIIKEYEAYNFDSTMYYIEQNLALCMELENRTYLNQTRLNLADLLATSGRYKESVDVLNIIEKNELSDELWADYYMHYKKVYYELKFHSSLKENTVKYTNLHNSYADSLLALLKPGTELYLEVTETRLREEGQLLEAKKINNKRLEKVKIGILHSVFF